MARRCVQAKDGRHIADGDVASMRWRSTTPGASFRDWAMASVSRCPTPTSPAGASCRKIPSPASAWKRSASATTESFRATSRPCSRGGAHPSGQQPGTRSGCALCRLCRALTSRPGRDSRVGGRTVAQPARTPSGSCIVRQCTLPFCQISSRAATGMISRPGCAAAMTRAAAASASPPYAGISTASLTIR